METHQRLTKGTPLYKERNRACKRSLELKHAFQGLSKQASPAQSEKGREPSREDYYALAKLGMELAAHEQEVIRLDKEIVKASQASGTISPEAAEKRLRQLNQRHFSLGDELWRNYRMKVWLEEPSIVPPVDIHAYGLVLALHRKSNVAKTKAPRRWRQDALAYYTPETTEKEMVWCHISGKWWRSEYAKATHIVPFFGHSVSKRLFGSQMESLDRAGNALLLSNRIKSWFDTYHLVVVPVDPTEMPIRRWRTDIISPDIKNAHYFSIMSPDRNNGQFSNEWPNSDFDGKELVFLNHMRPISRFMYFRFVMTLVRIRDLNRPGWQDVWAKYYQQRPFPAPSPFVHRKILSALATHFGTTDLHVVDSWVKDNGFHTPWLLDEEAKEVARRVHAALEEANRLQEYRWNSGADSSDDDSSEDSWEDSSGEEWSEDDGYNSESR